VNGNVVRMREMKRKRETERERRKTLASCRRAECHVRGSKVPSKSFRPGSRPDRCEC